MSRSKSSQLVGRDLIRGAREGFISAFDKAGDALPAGAVPLLSRLEELEEEIAAHAGENRLTDKELTAYANALLTAHEGIIALSTVEGTIDARTYLSLTLTYIEDVRNRMPARPEARWDCWFSAAETLAALLRCYRRAPRREDRGVEAGERILRSVA